MLEKSELIEIVQSAFIPLEYVAELKDYEHAFGFAVYLPDGSRIVSEHNRAESLLNESSLSDVVVSVRRRIADKGIKLEDWVLPAKP